MDMHMHLTQGLNSERTQLDLQVQAFHKWFAYMYNMYMYGVRRTHVQYPHLASPPRVCLCMRANILICVHALYVDIVLKVCFLKQLAIISTASLLNSE